MRHESVSAPEPDAEFDSEDGGSSGDCAEPDPGAATEFSAALVEVLPGIAVVLGEVPEALRAELIDFGVVPAADRAQLTTNLISAIGNTATGGGNLANAVASAQGLYRVNSATQALLNQGAVLAVKDGANLGSVWLNGKLVAQARFIPIGAINAAALAAAIGPAVAMVALQVQLQQISTLVRINIATTTKVLSTIRNEQWAELTGHVGAIEVTLNEARELESVPLTLWENVSGSEGALQKQLDLYRRHVDDHVSKLEQLGRRERREYLDTNAEAIVFDTHALLSSLKAWTGYQALRAGRARTAGRDEPTEAKSVDVIVRSTRERFEPALAEATHLADALTRELRILVDLPGPKTLGRTRKDTRLTRDQARDLLRAIEPLADALRPPVRALEAPDLVCTPVGTEVQPYLDALRWIIDGGETLRAVGVCYGRDAAIGDRIRKDVLSRFDAEKWATVLALTDRRLIVSRASGLSQEASINRQIRLDDVRYVRARASAGEIDVITRSDELHWVFPDSTDDGQIKMLAAALAESMNLPDAEREALLENAQQIVAPEAD